MSRLLVAGRIKGKLQIRENDVAESADVARELLVPMMWENGSVTGTRLCGSAEDVSWKILV